MITKTFVSNVNKYARNRSNKQDVNSGLNKDIEQCCFFVVVVFFIFILAVCYFMLFGMIFATERISTKLLGQKEAKEQGNLIAITIHILTNFGNKKY